MTEDLKSDVEPLAGELVVTPGLSLDVWKSSDSTFVPALKTGMTLEQRRSAVREVLRGACHASDRLNFVAAEMLYEAGENGYFRTWTYEDEDGETKTYTKLEDFALREMNMKPRKVWYLVDIYKRLIVELKIPIERVRDLEWSKAKEITKIITEDNWEEILDRIRHMTVREVAKWARERRGGALPAPEKKEDEDKRRSFIFKVDEEDASHIELALEIAEGMSGDKDKGALLQFICADFVSGSGGKDLAAGLLKLDIAMKALEKAFDVKLQIAEAGAKYEKVGA